MPSQPVQSKEAKKAARAARRQASKERRQQLWQAFNMQRKEDRLLIPLLLAAFIGSVAIFTIIGVFTGSLAFLIPLGIVLGVLAAFIIFGRRIQSTVYRKAEGQKGASAWALDQLRGAWRVQQTVAATTHLDAVHRALGRPGVVLVGEGAPQRIKPLLAQEKKRVARIVGDTPIYEVIVGNDDGQVPLSKLNKHLGKLPKNIDRKRLDELDSRLAALGARGPAQGMPKGPIPTAGKVRGMQRTARRR